MFYTLPETGASKTAGGKPSESSDRLAKLIREVKRNVAGSKEYKKKLPDDSVSENNSVEDEVKTDEDIDKVKNDAKASKAAGKEKKKAKKPDGGYREDYYEDGSYNEDYYSYTDPTYLDGPPDKSGKSVQHEFITVLNQLENL